MNDAKESGRESSPELSHLGQQVDNLRNIKARHSKDGADNFDQRYKRVDVARLVDSPPCQVRANPWTNVTDDDGLVSHLVSVWSTWDHIFYNFIDERLFMRDMKRHVLGSTFCSPFLVNSLLALSCPYSDYEESKPRRGATSALMQDFIEEAKRLLEHESQTPSITTVQGLGCLFLAIAGAGQDWVGYQYMQQAISMCEALSETNIRRSDAIANGVGEEELSKAIDYTCWGIFNVTTMASLAWQRPQSMEIPMRSKPEVTITSDGIDDWTPYPQQDHRHPARKIDLMQQQCGLSVIGRQATHAMFGKDREGLVSRKLLEELIPTLHTQMLCWRNSLPRELLPIQGSPPSILVHHSYYQVMILSIYGALKQKCAGASEHMIRQAEMFCREAAVEVTHLCRLHQEVWGVEHLNIFLIQPITLSLYTFMDDNQQSPESRSMITDLCIIFRALSRRFTFGMNVLRMVQLSAEQRAFQLPPETARLFQEFETHDWSKRKSRKVVSIYPAALPGNVQGSASSASRTVAGHEQVKNMTDFFELLDDLNLRGKSEEAE
ncbi:MAG: hypothetical protein Q9227_004183 [Pyrenula ochraceoflavens]